MKKISFDTKRQLRIINLAIQESGYAELKNKKSSMIIKKNNLGYQIFTVTENQTQSMFGLTEQGLQQHLQNM